MRFLRYAGEQTDERTDGQAHRKTPSLNCRVITYDAGDIVVLVDRRCRVTGKLAARVAVALLVRKFAHVLPHELLKLVLRPGNNEAK